ncbi:GAF domain-containing sensor histidine kinase [Taibaiella koreensis]|uniref:GAF domain-containing sensor histidine kinase n=1 Tax=Taibaiella koreensis TaxID=1268548 RepID=UPI000E599DCA|nr:GAF domain-containing sensor histidine kinase [Taibaiella koreensis]
MTNLPLELQADLLAIGEIDAIPSILKVLCHTTGMGFAAVARVTEKKWIACAVEDRINFGLSPGGELVVETTICHEIRQTGRAVVFNHASQNEIYQKHHTPRLYGIESYISVPIVTKSGAFFGTLCAIDPRPAEVENEQVIQMFELYADLIAFHLHALEQKSFSEMQLREERLNSELREQFIAVLGHDLRNPAGAVANVASLLLGLPLNEQVKQLAGVLQNSAYRMKGLIDNIMDFAQGRLGSGIILDIKEVDAGAVIKQVVGELLLIWPEQHIETDIKLSTSIHCDALRLAQLLSNILSNAISHGKQNEPVRVEAKVSNNRFVLSVSNTGTPIPDHIKDRLFQPFFRGNEKSKNTQGLGLGLYISSEIAKAHGGTLIVDSSAEKTCFTLDIPTVA